MASKKNWIAVFNCCSVVVCIVCLVTWHKLLSTIIVLNNYLLFDKDIVLYFEGLQELV